MLKNHPLTLEKSHLKFATKPAPLFGAKPRRGPRPGRIVEALPD
jgi:hypothetical protein